MPIDCPVTISRLSANEFEKVDYRVMGHAYASQNELGRLCDECAYNADMKARLLSDGFHAVLTEIPVIVTHRDFAKKYFLDLVAEEALYELKAEGRLAAEHDTQLFNYMFLLGLQRAKLLNFRGGKVQGRTIATSLTQSDRRQFVKVVEHWKDLTAACVTLRETLCVLLEDWGAFLEVNLYQEALLHFLGGVTNIEQRISLRRNGLNLGTQRMLIHAPGVAFRLTAVTADQQHVESHLRRLLALTELRAIQWINLNHARIEFTTIYSMAEKGPVSE
jgi:GxxExxY protein